MQFFFANFVRIHTNKFIQLLYKLYYEFVHGVVFVPIPTFLYA